ncbi:transmembrane and ubiquitin-like domain-containing protein 1 [Bacillus rossius redtenbacheri]|uniref:transmembrane and ubiquitin-like domain-containing protein 1 n=1 Tax=Bacillus rossius redtenbacheri TaxID=93214 RepID=UPI002FDC944D
MTIIEGIGDEVTQFFFAVVVIVVTLIAWRSTHIMEQPFFRTVLIVQRRRRRFQRRMESPRRLLEAANMSSLQDAGGSESRPSAEEPCATCSKAGEGAEGVPEGTCVEQAFTTRLVRSPNMIFTRGDEAPSLRPETQPAGSDREEADGDAPEAESEHLEEPSSEMGNIRIRLKYLNDDQKLVEGRLAEPLGDFKRRHFGLELAADKLVRLVYNGQVLSSDSQTLEGYGLFDNCVVHCLVHQPRTPPAAQAPASVETRGDAPRDRDLGHLLFLSLSLVLGLAWYCRYQYSQLFSATTTVALVGLSGVLAVALVGTYLPDPDAVRRRA